jgi:hypothetical protein
MRQEVFVKNCGSTAKARRSLWSGALTIGMLFAASDATLACDEFAGRLLSTYLSPAIASLGCSALGRAGLDNANHKLESVCYTSSGPTSSVQIVASLHCHTSDAAFIKASVSERVTADATVRGSDCSVQGVTVRPSGDIGKVLSQAFDLDGRARTALQEGLDKICAGPK